MRHRGRHRHARLAAPASAVEDPFSGASHIAEVLNLSRNVWTEGTGDGSATFQPADNSRAHVFIRSAAPQTIRYAELVLLARADPTNAI